MHSRILNFLVLLLIAVLAYFGSIYFHSRFLYITAFVFLSASVVNLLIYMIGRVRR